MICWLKTYVWIQSAGDAQAQRAILFFGQGNALSTACCGGKFRGQGGVGGGGSRMICWPKTYVWPDSIRR